MHRFSGSDGRNVSIGIHHQKGLMNAPTVLNSVFNFTQFWNGRARTIHNSIEMGLSPNEAAQRIQSHLVYSNLFFKITGRKNVNPDDIAMMIAEYEKTLITPNSKFDLYLLGKGKLSPKELEGYTLFKTLG
ncbi:MAG: cytochrome-c peroxidase, partial [Epsilonproteobacteria bacterium]|nr:cytochrome-c peroxidase [Campylobacterota bacterium]